MKYTFLTSGETKDSETIQSSRAFLIETLEHLPFMIFIKDSDELKFIYVNKHCESLLGYSRSDLVGKSDFDFFPKEQAEFFIQKDKEVLKQGLAVDISEEAIKTRHKGERWLHTKKIPIKVPSVGTFLVGISEDITEFRSKSETNKINHTNLDAHLQQTLEKLKSIEESLANEKKKSTKSLLVSDALEDQLSLLADALPNCVSLIDSDLTYSFVNTAYEKRHTKAKFEMIGYPLSEVFGNANFNKLQPYIQKALKGDTISFKLPITDSLDRNKNYEFTYLPYYSRSQEKIVGLLEISREISDDPISIVNPQLHHITHQNSNLANNLANNQELSDVDRLKAFFLSNLNYEMRTAIYSILGMADLLLDTGLKEEQKESVKNIKSSITSLLSVVNDIVDFSTMDDSEIEIDSVTFDLISTTQDLQKTYSDIIRDKNIVVTTELDPNIPPYLKGDPARLRQVVANFLSTAIKSTEKGQIVLRIKVLERDRNRVKLEYQVQDTGLTIPSMNTQTLLDSIQASGADSLHLRNKNGAALFMCKFLVELMGGKIGVSSSTSTGTTFWFQLFFQVADNQEALEFSSNLEIDRALSNNYRILIAEDNYINQRVTERILQKFGFHSDVAHNGHEVLEMLRNNRSYDLIIMDCNMPGMDGFETTQAIRKGQNLPSNIPIIAITSNAMKGDRQLCIEAGMDDYVPKPLSEGQFAKVLNKWIFRLERNRPKDNSKIIRPFQTNEPSVEIQHSKITDIRVPFDPTSLLENVEHDEELFKHVLSLFKTSHPVAILTIKSALEQGNAEALYQSAHHLKGELLTLGHLSSAKMAGELEERARKGTLLDLNKLVEALETETQSIIDYINSQNT
jgi:PAS domain S-box-containing protein